MNTIRLFDLRDVALIAQLENQGTSLCTEFALTRGSRPLQSALAGFFSLHSRGDYTLVMPNHPAGFVQMRPHMAVPHAIMTFVAPGLAAGDEATDVWAHLFDSMAKTAGELSLQQLVAEAPEDGPEITALHRAGFAVLLRQDILRLREGATAEPPADPPLRPCADTDAWGIQQLYFNTAPRLAQQAEAPPHIHHSGPTRGYVLEEDGETMAYLEIRRGPCGAWLKLVVHPQAEQHAMGVVAHGLTLLGPRWSAPVYWSVQRYQEWLWDPLQAFGFEPFNSVAVMVKRLVVPIAEPERVPAHILVQPKVTTPFVRSQNSHPS